jgi:hypothetical protein
VEGCGLNLLAHEEIHIASVESVEDDARPKDGCNETTVGHGIRWYVEAQSNGEEVEEKM